MTITRDVAIWGLTPQAIFAAIVIARGGRTVVMVGPDKQIGGMITGGLGITDAMPTRTWWGPVQEFTDLLSAATNYTNDRLRWNFYPAQALAAFNTLLSAEENITIRLEEAILSVTERQAVRNPLGQFESANAPRGAEIRSFATDAATYVASVFLDCSYGADLAALAGVPHLLGREANTFRDEIRAGVNFDHMTAKGYDVVDADGDLTKWGQYKPHQPNGFADRKTMGTGFRHMVTNIEALRIPWQAPPGYNVNDFVFDIQAANSSPSMTFLQQDLAFFLRRVNYDDARAAIHIPNYDILTRSQRETVWLGFTTIDQVRDVPDKFATNGSDIIGPLAWEYTYADEARRKEIRDHLFYRETGRWYTFANSLDVPIAVRNAFNEIGFCADEWQTINGGTPGFPPEIYHREGRRIRGQAILDYWHVMYQRNWPDQICHGGYFADSKAKTQFQSPEGDSLREGSYGDGSFLTEDGVAVALETQAYFGIPMRAVVPPIGVADNLAVCWGISATAMAFSAIRLEPFLSTVATAVGHMALESLASGTPMARLPYNAVRTRLDAAGALIYRYNPPGV